jgi:hypothetical protein
MIRRYESGELTTESRMFRGAMQQQRPVQQGRGCLGILAALTASMTAAAEQDHWSESSGRMKIHALGSFTMSELAKRR